MTIIELGLLGEMQLKGTRVGRLALAILKAVGDDHQWGGLVSALFLAIFAATFTRIGFAGSCAARYTIC